MNVTADIIRYEFVGTGAKIARSSNPSSVGMSGRVIDETKNTFAILDGQKKKIAVKDCSVFHFSFSDGTVVEIEGRLLMGRPEDRLKKTIRRLW